MGLGRKEKGEPQMSAPKRGGICEELESWMQMQFLPVPASSTPSQQFGGS